MIYIEDYKNSNFKDRDGSTHHFPKCEHLIRTKIIGKDPTSKVYKALVECIGSEKRVKLALSPGTYPRVIFRNLRDGSNFPPGVYQPGSNYINIEIEYAKGFEKMSDSLEPPLLERVILHETVHWGRYWSKMPGEVHVPGHADTKEAGSWFEHLAYGSKYQWHGTRVMKLDDLE